MTSPIVLTAKRHLLDAKAFMWFEAFEPQRVKIGLTAKPGPMPE